MSVIIPLIITGFFTLPQLVAGRSCYSRNGTVIKDIAYQPCGDSGESACCGTNHGGAGNIGIANDVCDTNGLCRNFEGFDGTNEGTIVWSRQGCTDPGWNTPDCLPNVCNTAEYQVDNAPVYSCGNGNWACGKQSYCSATPRLFVLAETLGNEISTYTTASSAALTASDGGQSASMPTHLSPGAAPPSSNTAELAHLSTAIKAGIGAGVSVLVLLLGIILFLLHKIKKSRKHQEAYAKAELPDQDSSEGEKPSVIVYACEVPHGTREMPSNEPPAHEMYGYRERAELDTMESTQDRGRARERV